MSLIQRVWNIQGTLHNVDGSAFNRGRILAYHLFPSNGWQQIAESYIDPATGAFELIFSTANFQEPDSETEFPTLQIRVTDYNYNPFWTSNIYSMPDTDGFASLQSALNYPINLKQETAHYSRLGLSKNNAYLRMRGHTLYNFINAIGTHVCKNTRVPFASRILKIVDANQSRYTEMKNLLQDVRQILQ